MILVAAAYVNALSIIISFIFRTSSKLDNGLKSLDSLEVDSSSGMFP